MPDLITSVHIKPYCFFKDRELSGKGEKNISKENKNGLTTYICISAMFMSFHLTVMYLK